MARPSLRDKRRNTLEVALRIKSPAGVLLAEHIIRGDRVELRSYFPSGQLMLGEAAPVVISMERFYEEVQKVLAERRAEDENESPYKGD